MTILNLFINFINTILKFRVLGVSLQNYLLAFLSAIFVFKIISIVGNSSKKGD